MANHNDYYDAGFHIFGLHGVTDGVCHCGNPKCEALFKHPTISNWQYTPCWSEEQFEAMEEYGAFDTGFGVLCQGYIIIDIDPRNGGNEGYDKLVKDCGIDFKKDAGFVVATGGGGWHIYYLYSGTEQIASHSDDYPGIDFKSSGFVVGCSSMHKSGTAYECESGHPDDITEAPQVLVDKLKKVFAKKKEFIANGSKTSPDELSEILGYVPNNDLEYDDFIEIGMIIHHATDGECFELWDNWAQSSQKYDPTQMEYKWHSFGKSPQPVTVGTLIHRAEANGYVQKVTFESNEVIKPEPVKIEEGIDLSKPMGLVGECASYINSCSRFPREQLAVSAALTAISTIGGMNYVDEEYGVTPNLFTFNVAGSATGKEAVQQAHNDLIITAGLGQTVYGSIKSEQEIYRNVLRHQSINYLIDEFGIMLNKIEQSSKTGASSYLGGVIGSLMSIYSKASGKLPLGADSAQQAKDELNKTIAQINKRIDENEASSYEVEYLEKLERIQMQISNGYIESPYLTLSGYTTPETFNKLVNYAQATNGFIGRAIIFEEKNNNPRAKKKFRKGSIDSKLEGKLQRLYSCGNASVMDSKRIEYTGKKVITTTPEADALLEKIQDSLHDQAELAMETNGLEAIVRRSFELILKVSMILAIGDGFVRTEQHVKWAHALIQRDIENKINLTSANIAEEEKNLSDEVLSKVKHKLDYKSGQTIGTLNNKLRSIDKENIQKALDYMVEQKMAKAEETQGKRGPTTLTYYLV